MTYFALVIGGVFGGGLRYVLDTVVPSPHSFPLTTLLINLVGSFVLGLFYGVADVRQIPSWLRVGFGTGVIGAFTTFSTFCLDLTHEASTDLLLAGVYAIASILGGPILAFFGDRMIIFAYRGTVKGAGELSV